MDSKYLACVIVSSLVPTPELLREAHNTICMFFAWSLRICMSGFMPETGLYGEAYSDCPKSLRAFQANRPIAAGARFAFAGLKSDRKANTQLHRYQQSHQAKFICESCLAMKPTTARSDLHYCYGNFQQNAPWRTTLRSHEDYVAQEGVSPWLQVPGFNVLLHYEDLMHNAFLGHVRDAIASTARGMIDDHLLPGATDKECLDILGLEFRQWCRDHKLNCPKNRFVEGSFGFGKDASYLVLHSRIKAAHCRILLGFVAAKCIAVDDVSNLSKLRTTCIWAIADFFGF